MFSRQVLLAGAVVLTLAATASAQPAGTLEVSSYGRYTDFGGALQMDNKFGAGGRLGYFFLSRIALEAGASVTATQQVGGPLGNVSYVPLHARLVYNQPLLGRLELLLGVGYVSNFYGANDGWFGDDGIGGLFGMRLSLSNTFALRLDGTADYLFDYSAVAQGVRDRTTLGLEAGISLMFGRGFGGGHWDPYGDQQFASTAPPPSATPPAAAEQPAVAETVPAAPAAVANEVTVAAEELVVEKTCPDAPAGAPVDDRGCPLPATDREVAEDVPEPAEEDAPEPAEVVEPEPDADADGDGVYDSVDACSETASGTRVDAKGCPVLFEEDKSEITLRGVTFMPGTWDLTPNARVILDGVAQALLANSSIRVEIAGFTDNRGALNRNLWLSQTRADAVKLYLNQQGVPRDRMVARGYGPSNPVASNDTSEGRALNRRVELRRLR